MNLTLARTNRGGLSLIELLIVLAIIALLVQLVLPAIEASRESARQTACQNNLRQLAIAAQLHESAHGHLPSGGWMHTWVGDPNRGFGKSQPGGWSYNLLPFLEQQSLHDLGKGVSEAARRSAGAQMFATPVPVFVCPSRRLARAWPFTRSDTLVNIDKVDKAGRSDYAANIGNLTPLDQGPTGPTTYEEADRWLEGTDPEREWIARRHNGVVYQRSDVRLSQITDGLSKTYLLGEKFLDPAKYKGEFTHGDDQSLYIGFDRDNTRSANRLHPPLRDKKVPVVWLEEDSELVTDWNFGSAHPTALHMAYCDGSVKPVTYDVSIDVHSEAGSRGR
jgi:prepilin-type N-terminal cleavage/methylation domain-containing protein